MRDDVTAKQKAVLGAFAILVVLLGLFPPYMGHAGAQGWSGSLSLGYFFIFDPPDYDDLEVEFGEQITVFRTEVDIATYCVHLSTLLFITGCAFVFFKGCRRCGQPPLNRAHSEGAAYDQSGPIDPS